MRGATVRSGSPEKIESVSSSENLRAEVVDIEALARAAEAAAELLPAPATDR